MDIIFEKSSDGRSKYTVPKSSAKDHDPIPKEFLNDEINLIDVNEVDVVRHYTKLSQMNFGVDTGMYPLGSCTMKYNPKINEKIASIPQFTESHPLLGEELCQGSLEILYDLAHYLNEITGMTFSLMPAAGSHGELAGCMIIKKYFEDIKEDRKIVLIPDSAHGTNPASVALCGFTVKEVPSNREGDVDIDAFKKLLDKNVAAMMLTSPNTVGLFDRHLIEVGDLLHKNGSLFYGDGANLNATLGKARMADMGFDIMHINLHKTFSTPHGGGGPGSGPVGVVKSLEKYLPVPVIEKVKKTYKLQYDKPNSIGRIHSFYGNFLIALRAYTYIRSLGPDDLKEVSETAVLNANYLLSELKKIYNLPIDRICMHEFVINDKKCPNHITTNDIAKRLLDFGYHAPTVYFPLLIEGAMMIEPTETESKESLDGFIDAMKAILKEAEEDPEIVLTAPHTTPVKRVDAVLAARKPVLVWEE